MSYIFFSSSLFRTPSLPYKKTEDILTNKDYQWLDDILESASFLYSIYLASPELHDYIIKAKADKNITEKLRLSILKYIMRSATRCVPYGMFSGSGTISNGSLSGSPEKNNIIIKEQRQTHTRIDSSIVSAIFERLENITAIRIAIDYYTNSSLTVHGRYYRYTYNKRINDISALRLMQTKKNQYLDNILKMCKNGASYTTILNFLSAQGFERDESVSYIEELINNDIIVSELQPSSLGNNLADILLPVMERLSRTSNDPTIQQEYLSIVSLYDQLILIDTLDIENSFSVSKTVQDYLQSNIAGHFKNFFHTDSFYDTDNVLPHSLMKEVVEGLDIYRSLMSLNIQEYKTDLDYFKESFEERYEEQEVLLSYALDVENGIGYGNTLNASGIDNDPLIKGLKYNYQNPKVNTTISWNILDSFVTNKIEKSILKGSDQILIDNEDLQKLKKYTQKSPYKISSSGYLKVNALEDKEKKNIIYIDSLSNSSPNKILGRFTIGNEKIKQLAQEIAMHEATVFAPDTIFAEIDHLPVHKSGNVINRANVRDYEISYMGAYKSNPYALDISDLYIRIENGEIVLFSKKLNKRVIPYFSNSYDIENPSMSPVFKFLVDLHHQYEDVENQYFDTRKYHNFYKHIPRIMYQNIIISRESWLITAGDFMMPQQKTILPKNVAEVCKRLRLPDRFVIIERDMELLIDIRNNDSVKIFIEELTTKKELHVMESLLEKFGSAFKNDKGEDLSNELFIPYKNIPEKKLSSIIQTKQNQTQRSFHIGSEWLYLKIYLGSAISDSMLTDLLAPINSLLKNEVIESFFFIKYKDPKNHIRLRFRLKKEENLYTVISNVNKVIDKYRKDNYISNVLLETYNRELERYGSNSIQIFEKIFHHDSLLTINILKSLKKKNQLNLKWLEAIVVMDIYCTAFGLSDQEKLNFVNRIKGSFSQEFGAEKHSHKFINQNYAKYKSAITDKMILHRSGQNPRLYLDFKKKLEKEYSLLENSAASQKLDSLNACIHMHIIRIMGASNNRLYEYVIYEFYSKFLTTLRYLKKDN